MVTPEFVKEKVPFIETDQFIGAFWTPGRRRRRLAAGRHDHARARDGARRADRRPTVEVTGLDVEDGRRSRITGCAPTGGDIEAETVVIAVRRVEPEDRRHGRRSSIPLTPAVHQMITVGPCPQLAETRG